MGAFRLLGKSYWEVWYRAAGDRDWKCFNYPIDMDELEVSTLVPGYTPPK